jgi:hypothetical protein
MAKSSDFNVSNPLIYSVKRNFAKVQFNNIRTFTMNISKQLLLVFLFEMILYPISVNAESDTNSSINTKVICSMVLDQNNGNMVFVISNNSFNSKQIDLEKFFSNRKPDYEFLQKFDADQIYPPQTIEFLEKVSKHKIDLTWDDINILGPALKKSYTYPNNDPPVPPHKIIELRKNESFYKTVKIWKIDIWDQLHEVLKKHPTHKFEVQYQRMPSLSKIVGEQSEPSIVIDNNMVQSLNKIQSDLKKKESNTKNISSQDKISLIKRKLELNKETGDLTIYLENPIDVVVTLDLEQPFFKNFKIAESQKNEEVIPVSMKQKREQPTFQRYRAIDLEEGEGFSKTIKIWELDIWSDIQNFFEKDRTKSCVILGEISCWIDGKEYLYIITFTLKGRYELTIKKNI